MQSLWISLALLLLCAGASADQLWRPGFPAKKPICSSINTPIPCNSNRVCQTICGRQYECVGCPNCSKPSEIRGSCYLEGTVAVRCSACPGPLPTPPPACDSSPPSNCLTDGECKSKCGASFECKKCPPNGCPGREIGLCLPSSEPLACTLEICTQDPPPKTNCVRAGCSGEICVDSSQGDRATGCIFKPEFDCYNTANCGNFGPGGSCGFELTPILTTCLAEKRGNAVVQG